MSATKDAANSTHRHKTIFQQGFSGTTTKEIAEAAGVSEAMVFRHFATKSELYHAILDHKACEGRTANPFEAVSDALAAKDDEQIFYKLMLNALKNHEEDPEFMRLLFHSAPKDTSLQRCLSKKTSCRSTNF